MLHAGELHQNLAELYRIALLGSMVGLRLLLGPGLARVVLYDLARPLRIFGIQEICSEKKPGSITETLIPNCSTSAATDADRPSTANCRGRELRNA